MEDPRGDFGIVIGCKCGIVSQFPFELLLNENSCEDADGS